MDRPAPCSFCRQKIACTAKYCCCCRSSRCAWKSGPTRRSQLIRDGDRRRTPYLVKEQESPPLQQLPAASHQSQKAVTDDDGCVRRVFVDVWRSTPLAITSPQRREQRTLTPLTLATNKRTNFRTNELADVTRQSRGDFVTSVREEAPTTQAIGCWLLDTWQVVLFVLPSCTEVQFNTGTESFCKRSYRLCCVQSQSRHSVS